MTIIVGNGNLGYSGDNGPASAAEIGQIFGLTVDPSGNVVFLDQTNRRIRAISTDGTIMTVSGDGSACSGFTDANRPLTGMCPRFGLDVAPDGAIYYGDDAGISRSVQRVAYHYAGQYTGYYPPADDGPRFGGGCLSLIASWFLFTQNFQVTF